MWDYPFNELFCYFRRFLFYIQYTVDLAQKVI
jgi:hypothetical protein